MQKVQLSREQGLALIQKWKASGQSIKEFCNEQSIPAHRLNYWKKKCSEVSTRVEGASKFLAIDLQTTTGSPQYEIQTPGGYLVKVYMNIGISELMRQLS